QQRDAYHFDEQGNIFSGSAFRTGSGSPVCTMGSCVNGAKAMQACTTDDDCAVNSPAPGLPDSSPLNPGGGLFDAANNPDGYLPMVAEVPVISADEPCQEIKSEDILLTRNDVGVTVITAAPFENAKQIGKPDGKFLAWALIDPRAEVDFTSDP